MSKFDAYLCDQCEVESDEPLAYRLAQISQEQEWDEGAEVMVDVVHSYDFCSTSCLQAWAVDVLFDFPEEAMA